MDFGPAYESTDRGFMRSTCSLRRIVGRTCLDLHPAAPLALWGASPGSIDLLPPPLRSAGMDGHGWWSDTGGGSRVVVGHGWWITGGGSRVVVGHGWWSDTGGGRTRVVGPRVVGPRVMGPRVVGPRVMGPRVMGPRCMDHGVWTTVYGPRD